MNKLIAFIRYVIVSMFSSTWQDIKQLIILITQMKTWCVAWFLIFIVSIIFWSMKWIILSGIIMVSSFLAYQYQQFRPTYIAQQRETLRKKGLLPPKKVSK